MNRYARIFGVLGAVILTLSGCQRPMPEEGYWTGALSRPDERTIPFRMFLNLKSKSPTGYFLVGNERTPIPQIEARNDSLSLIFSEYGAVMRGVWKDEEWKGAYIRFRSDTTSVPFAARPESSTRIVSAQDAFESPSGVRLVGKFQVYFQRGGTLDSATSGSFWAKSDSTFGTFVAPDGDYGLLTGRQIGNKILLSRFTGWQVIALDFEQKNGKWSGNYLVRSEAPRPFTLEPRVTLSEDLPLDRRTSMKNPPAPFVFSGITPEGDTLTHSSERFKGKILIIDVMGTWCHNCMDAAPLLEQISREYKDTGVEVVGLSFEINNDVELAKKNLKLYAQRHSITFPLLFCGSTQEANVEARLRSQLNNFFAYPTTFFTDRKGVVKKIHVGFKGPGTGEEYQRQVQEFFESVRRLAK